MKKFFLNKKLMTAVLSLSLIFVIGGIAVFAALQSGLPGVEKILGGFDFQIKQESSESSSSEEEKPVQNTYAPSGETKAVWISYLE